MKTLRDALRSEELALTAELTLTPRDAAPGIIEQAKTLAATVDAIQIPDQRYFRPHMSNLAVAALLSREGIDTVVHMNCRDRNRVALLSDILGARGIGANNLLIVRGAKFPPDQRPPSTSVFDLSAIDLIATAAAVRDGDVFEGSEAEGAAELFIGTVATAFEPQGDWTPEKLTSKADAGAQFIQLQPCHDIELLRAYVGKIVEARLTWRFQLLAAIVVLPSADAARELRGDRPDSIIPARDVARLETAEEPQAEGIALAADQLRAIADIPGISGVTLSTPGDAALIPAAIRAAGLRA